MNAAALVMEANEKFGERAALYFNDEPVSFSELMELTDRARTAIARAGVKPGERFLLLADNSPEWIACYLGALAEGVVLVPLNPALSAAEIAYIAKDCQPRLALCDPHLAEKLPVGGFPIMVLADTLSGSGGELPAPRKPVVEMDQEAPALIFYTSGTTGQPKGVVLSHRATSATIERTASWLESDRSDRALVTGSLAFIMNSSIMAAGHLSVGATLVLAARFHPAECAALIERHKVTAICFVPTMYVMLMEYDEKSPIDLSSLRICISGGAPLLWPVAERFEKRFGKHILSGWGMTEGTPVTGFDVKGKGRPDSTGKPLPGCEVKVMKEDGREGAIGEIGELIYRSPNMMSGYLNKPAETAETLRDGWMWTGDLGKLDEEGFVYILGRSKDLIIRGGANIYPAEVEAVLEGLNEVAEASVVGVPDERFGERVGAVIRVRKGDKVSIAEILDGCRACLAEYKIPEKVVLIEEDFPRGPTGKILKRKLIDYFVTHDA